MAKWERLLNNHKHIKAQIKPFHNLMTKGFIRFIGLLREVENYSEDNLRKITENSSQHSKSTQEVI